MFISERTVPPTPPSEIYLHPGEYHFGDGRSRVRTILGSCVAVTFWHPQRNLGALCHYLLPSRSRAAGTPVDGRYGDEVIQLIADRFRSQGLQPGDFQVMIFGGSNMFPQLMPQGGQSIGVKNIEMARTALGTLGFRILKADVGHCRHRNLLFDTRNGEVWVRRSASKCEMNCVFKPEEGCPHVPASLNRAAPAPSPAT